MRHGQGREIQLRDRPLLRASLQRIREQVRQVRLPRGLRLWRDQGLYIRVQNRGRHRL